MSWLSAQVLLYRIDLDLMARDDEGNTPVQLATELLSRQARTNGNVKVSEGPRMVLDFLRRKAELERVANAGKLANV
jgi:hypothetical protein